MVVSQSAFCKLIEFLLRSHNKCFFNFDRILGIRIVLVCHFCFHCAVLYCSRVGYF